VQQFLGVLLSNMTTSQGINEDIPELLVLPETDTNRDDEEVVTTTKSNTIMHTTTAAALSLIVFAVTLTAGYHQYRNATHVARSNNNIESITIEDYSDDADDPFWNFSNLNLEDVSVVK